MISMSLWAVGSTVIAMFMAITMFLIRLKSSEKPITEKRIILPPLMMSTGALMFILPEFRLSVVQVLEALIVGVLFSTILIKTSKIDIIKQQFYLRTSKYFPLLLIGLLVVRMILKLIVQNSVPLGETSGMFFLLAFGMILSWRLTMLYRLKKVKREHRKETELS